MIGKFKVWDSKKKEFLKSHKAKNYFIHNRGKLHKYMHLSKEVKLVSSRFVPVHSTGKTDKNGVELFDGDVLRVKNNWGIPVAEIWWNTKTLSWNVGPEWFLGALIERNVELKRIGNKFENPELMETK